MLEGIYAADAHSWSTSRMFWEQRINFNTRLPVQCLQGLLPQIQALCRRTFCPMTPLLIRDGDSIRCCLDTSKSRCGRPFPILAWPIRIGRSFGFCSGCVLLTRVRPIQRIGCGPRCKASTLRSSTAQTPDGTVICVPEQKQTLFELSADGEPETLLPAESN